MKLAHVYLPSKLWLCETLHPSMKPCLHLGCTRISLQQEHMLQPHKSCLNARVMYALSIGAVGMQFAAGHNCYSWLSWLQSAAPAKMIDMEYSHPCEPYVIALSDAMPRYNERFRGRGQNKVEQLTHMAAWGFEWKLLPAHFVIHLPHASSPPQEGGWEVSTTVIALLKLMLREVQKEPQFKQHVQQDVPLPIKY